MFKFFALILIAGAIIGGYFLGGGGKTEAFHGYEKFADALHNARWVQAEAMASGDAAFAAIDAERAVEREMGGNAYRQIVGVVHNSDRKVESETVSADGKTDTLEVTELARRGSETMAPIGPATVKFHTKVVMVLTDAGWRVDSYVEEATPLTGD